MIELNNVSKSYERGKRALKNVTLTIRDGEFVFIMGRSGAGKSTLLRLLMKETDPTEGTLVVNDVDLNRLSRRNVPKYRRTIGVVFQDFRLLKHLNVYENVAFAQRVIGKSTAEIRENVPEVLRRVGLSAKYKANVRELSGGEQQRVAIARALVKVPRVLLLDEPLSNLDARLRLQTREEIKRIQRETGVTTVFVTHDQEEAMSISDLIVVMEAGVVQQIAKPQIVYEDPINLFVAKFLGTPPINVFEGEVRGGIVYIGEDAGIKAEPDSSWKDGAPDAAPGVALQDGPVTIGIRPEGFDPEKDGELRCGLTAVEVMGRDTSIVATNAHAANGSIRTIVSTEELAEVSGETVNFRIKPARIYLFDHETGTRVRCTFKPLH